MGEQAAYALHLDWDRDGYFCEGVSASDPLNIIPSPVRLAGLFYTPLTSNSAIAQIPLDTAYGNRVWVVDTGGDSGGGVRIGQHPSLAQPYVIPVLTNTAYILKVWIRLISSAGNTDLRLRLSDPIGVTTIGTTNFTPASTWTALTVTGTTGSSQTYIRIILDKRTNADRVVVQMAGLMLVPGSTAPTAFNAGDASNAYDDVWSLCEELRFSYGIHQYTEAVAPASSLTVTVNNMDGAFSPENAPAARSRGSVQNLTAPEIGTQAVVGFTLDGDNGIWQRPGFFSRGVLARLRATYDSIVYPLYIGTLDSVRPAVGLRGSQRAELTFVDPVPQLNTAEYRPPLQEDVTTGEVLQALFDGGVIVYPYPGDYWVLGVAGASELGVNTYLYENLLTDFDAGETDLAFTGDATGGGNLTSVLAFIRDIVYAELGGRFFWDAPTGQFKFFSRIRDILYQPSVEAPGALELDAPPIYVWGDDVLNRVTVTYYPRVIGAAGSTLYTLGNVPMALAAGQRRTMTVRYQVLDALNAGVAGKDMITPVPVQDYTASANADGSGTDLTSSLTITCNFNAVSADLTFVNNGGAALYVQSFRLRGTPLVSYRAVQATAFDGASLLAQGEASRVHDLPALGDSLLAESFANYLVQRYKTPAGRIAAASVIANRDAAAMANVLGMRVGNHVRLYDAFLNNQIAKYVVTGMTHTITPGKTHRLRLDVEPLDRYLYWILGDATLSVLGETTRLSF